ncbi:ribonuclease HIII [Kiritimatiella glycovorans]|uniref:Ribonuclease n=1 Tax=Kiritimatiella glycovorans TaxID=1307763 RepID=A0A0G3EFE7_9BACT|nr:ribonuclease HIII [Kiritimatiella glycovorans]AKJ65176.1 Ribonuclease HIII [Kiritimatiella glycovorans]
MKKTSFTRKLTPEQQECLVRILDTGNYRPAETPHTIRAVKGRDCNINLYRSGKCVVQGRGAEDWVLFTLEPEVLRTAEVGYEDALDPALREPHLGVDESGKGDYFGPLVVAAAYVNAELVDGLRGLNVRDSKNYSSDRALRKSAEQVRELLEGRYALVPVNPSAYNRLYDKMRNVNSLVAWGHARAIENLLEQVPDCPRAVLDKFGPTHRVERALMKRGRGIRVEQRVRAEDDPAVAAASVLARDEFLSRLEGLGKTCGVALPKGASGKVRAAAEQLVRANGPEVLRETAKCHFRTTDRVLEACGEEMRSLSSENGKSESGNP